MLTSDQMFYEPHPYLAASAWEWPRRFYLQQAIQARADLVYRHRGCVLVGLFATFYRLCSSLDSTAI